MVLPFYIGKATIEHFSIQEEKSMFQLQLRLSLHWKMARHRIMRDEVYNFIFNGEGLIHAFAQRNF